MAATSQEPDTPPPPPPPPSSSFSPTLFNRASRLPDDTVFYALFPDSPLPAPSLQALHLQILQTLAPLTADYLWHHEPFSLRPSSAASAAAVPHLHGKLRFGDCLDDEWFAVFLLLRASAAFPDLSVRVWDSDGEFLLIEAAYHLPRWLTPEASHNRVFLRRGEVHIVPRALSLEPTLERSLRLLAERGEECRASEAVQATVRARVAEYPEKARRNVHRARVRVPASVARVLREEPSLVALAVEGFYDRDVDSMRFAAAMERFLPEGEEMVTVSARMSRAMYAQLAGQAFQAPKRYPMPPRRSGVAAEEYAEAELGMKIACGFEMVYQQRRREGLEGNAGTWEAFRESLERSGYFQGLVPGSQEHRRLMSNAEEYYRNSSSFSRACEIMSAPVRRMDEILALPYSADDFKGQEVPPSDDDSWLYSGEDELNSALSERTKELELYNAKHKNKQKSKAHQDAGESSSMNVDDFDPSEIAKTMKAFVSKVSSYEGAEVPKDRDLKEVNLDVDRFLKDMESVMNHQGFEDMASDDDIEEGSFSDFDFEEESENESDVEEPSEAIDGEKDTFMHSYSDALDEELKTTTIGKSFVRAKEQAADLASKKSQGTSNTTADMDEEFTPVDADVNLVKSFLDSFASQEGLPGPASNLLGLMGLQLQDAKKDK